MFPCIWAWVFNNIAFATIIFSGKLHKKCAKNRINCTIFIKNYNETKIRPDKGEIYENFIANQLRRKGKELFFWNYRNTYEMDFVIEEAGKIIGIEIKSKIKQTKPSKSTKEFIKQFRPDKVIILNENLDYETKIEKTKIIFTNHINICSLF